MIDNEALQLGVTISPQNTTERVIFRSSNNAVAVVNASGLVTALSPGEVVITATSQSGKVSASVTVTVLAVNVTKVEFAQDYLLLEVEQSESLSYTVSPQNASNKAVTFTSSDDAVATVDATGHVTAVAQGVAQITVTSVENGTLLDTMDIVVVVPKSTIAEAKAASNNTVIRVEGVVTHLLGNSAFIHDGVEGFYLYNARVNFADEVQVGNLITITGSRAVFNNLMQLSNPTQAYVLKTNQPLPTPVVLDSETVMLPLQGAPVSLNGYFISSKATISGTGASNIIFSNFEGDEFIVRVDSQTNLTAEVRDPIVNYFNALGLGAFINVTNAPLGWFSNDPQIMITNVNQLSAGTTASYEDMAAYVAENTILIAQGMDVIADVILPTTGFFGSTITWESSHPSIVSNTGVVNRPEFGDGDAAVVLTYTITINDVSTFTGTVELNVIEAPEGGVQGTLMIYEWYGAGGNSGAIYTHDYVILYNGTNQAIDLSTYSLQYASSTGTSWQRTNLTGSIAAGGYYVIRQAKGSGGTTELPYYDVSGSIAMAAAAGKVALVSNQTNLTGSDPQSNEAVVDFLGIGTANAYEGAGAAPAPTNNTHSIKRTSFVDTDNNNLDFASSVIDLSYLS